jgi:hypothetical protein
VGCAARRRLPAADQIAAIRERCGLALRSADRSGLAAAPVRRDRFAALHAREDVIAGTRLPPPSRRVELLRLPTRAVSSNRKSSG